MNLALFLEMTGLEAFLTPLLPEIREKIFSTTA